MVKSDPQRSLGWGVKAQGLGTTQIRGESTKLTGTMRGQDENCRPSQDLRLDFCLQNTPQMYGEVPEIPYSLCLGSSLFP
jgi:hypothetical protein